MAQICDESIGEQKQLELTHGKVGRFRTPSRPIHKQQSREQVFVHSGSSNNRTAFRYSASTASPRSRATLNGLNTDEEEDGDQKHRRSLNTDEEEDGDDDVANGRQTSPTHKM